MTDAAKNFLTPEDASKKWCPFVRNLYREERGPSKDSKNSQLVVTNYNADRNHNKCISVNCMLWYDKGDGTGCCGMKAL